MFIILNCCNVLKQTTVDVLLLNKKRWLEVIRRNLSYSTSCQNEVLCRWYFERLKLLTALTAAAHTTKLKQFRIIAWVIGIQIDQFIIWSFLFHTLDPFAIIAKINSWKNIANHPWFWNSSRTTCYKGNKLFSSKFTKGQIISKFLFGVFNFWKTNWNMLHMFMY